MQIINTNNLPEETWAAPDSQHTIAFQEISEALGRLPASMDSKERHPFDVEIQRIPAGVMATSYHSHSAQWEFYHVIYGGGTLRHDGGLQTVEPGDAFIFKLGQPHQLIPGPAGLVAYVVADNPVGDQGSRVQIEVNRG